MVKIIGIAGGVSLLALVGLLYSASDAKRDKTRAGKKIQQAEQKVEALEDNAAQVEDILETVQSDKGSTTDWERQEIIQQALSTLQAPPKPLSPEQRVSLAKDRLRRAELALKSARTAGVSGSVLRTREAMVLARQRDLNRAAQRAARTSRPDVVHDTGFGPNLEYQSEDETHSTDDGDEPPAPTGAPSST